MRSLSLALAAILLAAPALAQQPVDLSNTPSGTYGLDKHHASLIFNYNHMGYSTYYARFNHFDVTLNFDADHPESSKLSVEIDPASIDSNDDSMEAKFMSREFFDTQKFPRASFTSTRIQRLSDRTGRITPATSPSTASPSR